MGFWKDFEETNENKGHPQSTFATISAASKAKTKKILAERNVDEPPLPYSSNTHLEKTPQEKPAMGFDRVEARTQESHPLSLRFHPSSDSSRSVPYNPVNNYTSPRPAFLRYNPDQHKEILLRMRDEEGSVVDLAISQDQEKSVGDDLLLVSSTSPKLGSQVKGTQKDAEDESDAEADDFREEEVEERRRPWCFRMVWKLLFLYGVFLFSHHYLFPVNSSSNSIQENVRSTDNSLYRNLLKTHMRSSDVCLDIGEGMCGIEGPGSDLVVVDDSVMGQLGDSAKNEFLMPDEVDGELDLVEKESIDGIEFLEERDEGLVGGDSDQNVEEFVVGEGREEPVSSHEFLEVEENSQREGSGKDEILGNETIKNLGFASVETPDDHQIVSDALHTYQEELIETNSIEEAQGEESLEFSESQFQSVPNLVHDDQAAEESELPTVYTTSSKWKLGLVFASKDVQLLVLLSLSLLAVVTILLSGMFKYFSKSHQKSSQISPPSPEFLPGEKSVDEKRMDKYSNVDPLVLNHSNTEQKESSLLVSAPSPMLVLSSVSAVSMMKELKAGAKDSNFNLRSSNYSADELQGFYATRPSSVELLAEFSILDGLASRAASAQTLKSKGFQESEFPKFQRGKGSEESQLSLSERSQTVKIKSPSSSSKVHLYLAAESTASDGSYTQDKLEKKEDTVARGDAKKMVATPLRRSSRLQNRVTSPTP